MEIYEPAEDSYLLQKVVRQRAFGRVLDLGTGSGIQALEAAGNQNVKEVVAADINAEAVHALNEKIKKGKIRKIKTIKSDLFLEISGKFNTIIFNPPYLPQDYLEDGTDERMDETGWKEDKNIKKKERKKIEDPALYGGKKGWEISERFFAKASKFLFSDGEIIFLFSTLTNKGKIEEIIKNHLLEFEEVASEKLSFEKLYVYKIIKSKLLRELEAKGIENISYLGRGQRGDVYIGLFDQNVMIKSFYDQNVQIKSFISGKNPIKVAIKVEREGSKAQNRINNEIFWTKELNKEGIGPRLLLNGKIGEKDKKEEKDYLVTKFVEGLPVYQWIMKQEQKAKIKAMFFEVMRQCFVMDKMKASKGEMHHPLKHIIVTETDQPIMLDFERCVKTEKPQNLTQFVEFICRMQKELKSRGFSFKAEDLRQKSKRYKEQINEEQINEKSFQNLKNAFD